MRRTHPDLPRYTWDQATILNLWPAATFRAVKIAPGTVRRWASEGCIKPVGIGPRGIVLYRYETVVQRAKSGCL